MIAVMILGAAFLVVLVVFVATSDPPEQPFGPDVVRRHVTEALTDYGIRQVRMLLDRLGVPSRNLQLVERIEWFRANKPFTDWRVSLELDLTLAAYADVLPNEVVPGGVR